jgi:amidase
MSVIATDIWRMGAKDLAGAIQSKQVSSREVVQSHLLRIEAINPALNAITVVLAEQALVEAEAADRAIASGHELKPFHGVPFTIKENLDVAGTATSQGVQALSGADPGLDAPNVERMRAAGAIAIGRTNLPDFALRWHTDNELRGATINPWDRKRTPGGSSGGEAAALATGMTPFGLGNDLGGSLRWPAQCCGIASLKPTIGRIPHATTIEPVDGPISIQLMAVEGPMARRVADLRAGFETMAGSSWRDPWTVPAPTEGPAPPRPIRIALVTDPAGLGTAKQVADGVRKAARALVDAGYAVDEAEPPSIELAAKAWQDILNPDIRAMWQIMTAMVGADANRFMAAAFAVWPVPDPVTTMQSFMARQALLRAWGEFQQKYPLVLAPIYTDVPFEVGKDLTENGVAEILRGMRMVVAMNALGLPAVAVPVGVDEGLPQSVQVIGPRYREDLCLDAGEALERSLGVITPIDPN